MSNEAKMAINEEGRNIPNSKHEQQENPNELETSIQSNSTDVDDAEIEHFIKKYGDVKVSYINPPKINPWFTRPYALNYFYNGRLFRTRHERTSGKLELFLDLVYVGIVANIASTAVEEHDGLSFLKYFLVFIPAWTIWVDMKEFMNYYFNDDLLQRFYVLLQIVLLIVYDNNVEFIDDLEDNTGLLTSVICYSCSRIAFSLMLIFYSIFIKEHQFQMRLGAALTIFTSGCWYFILLIKENNWGKCIFAGILFVVEQTIFSLSVHPWTKKKLGLKYSTALNIEHEDERFHAFYVIAIGEFLYSIVDGSPLKLGWNTKLAKGIALTIQAFLFLGIYSHKDGCLKAVHALRRSVSTAMIFMYAHFPLIASLLIVGDSGADLCKIEDDHLLEEEFGILMYFHGGILIALISLTVLALTDKDMDEPGDQFVNRYIRIGARIPIGLLILGFTWSYKDLKIVSIIWLDTLFLILLFLYEFTLMNPINFGKVVKGAIRIQEV